MSARPATDGSLEPPLLQSLGALAVSHMAGEQLVFADKNSRLVPRIATSWKSSNKAKTWTFQIRKNVKFHDGTPLTADDVVTTFKRLLTKDSQAQSSYKGVIVGVKKTGTHTVEFNLAASNGFFPYALSQQTYQAIILPKTYKLPSDITKPGEWTSKMNGTGPFRLKENRGAAGLTFEANPDYWGGRPSIDTVDVADPRGSGARDGAPERSDRPGRPAQLPGRPAGRAPRRSHSGRRRTATCT